jgi:DNA replication and repair protein RecF
MKLTALQITNFRNFSEVSLQPAAGFNIIYGDNGSGKTSLLEAIYYLSHARSFRTHLPGRIIKFEQPQTTLFAEIERHDGIKLQMGLARDQAGDCKIKIGQNLAKTAAELAAIMPVQVINPDSFDLLDDGPKHRRALLDWGLFHVEQNFFSLWQRLQRAIKQRSAALRERLAPELINVWDIELVQVAEQIDHYRAQYCQRFSSVFHTILQDITPISDISFDYYRGWPRDAALAELLQSHLSQDYERGFTFYGPQRADIVLKRNKIPLHDVLSRGQQKLVIAALKLAQGCLLAEEGDKRCIYLVDDLAAELGPEYREFILEVLAKIQAQVFITAIEKSALLPYVESYPKSLFHVEQGQIHIA